MSYYAGSPDFKFILVKAMSSKMTFYLPPIRRCYTVFVSANVVRLPGVPVVPSDLRSIGSVLENRSLWIVPPDVEPVGPFRPLPDPAVDSGIPGR